jgi:non-canonical purine NTP pyrophosphatase (RdgB/HAM1 family)
MKELIFVTGNAAKAQQLSRHLDYPVSHIDLDLVEIQSLDVKEIAIHKVKEAYSRVIRPVLVEDTSLVFIAMGKLPGPLIKWFYEEMGNEGLCKLLNSYQDRNAYIEVNFVYYDGIHLQIFDAVAEGYIAAKPKGSGGFGWDPIFINKGYSITRAEMSVSLYDQTSPRSFAVSQLHTYITHRY